jgi:DNA polymerase-3 subunit epsilon
MSILAGVKLLAVDTETTGFDAGRGERIVEVARVEIVNGQLAGEWTSLVHPGKPIPEDATKIHGINDAMVAGAPPPAEVGRTLREACADLPLVFHNAPFDLPFLAALFREAGVPPLLNPIVDTLGLARGLPGTGGNSLGALAARFKLPAESAHRALGDTRTTARLFLRLVAEWETKHGIRSLAELAAVSQDVVRTTARR